MVLVKIEWTFNYKQFGWIYLFGYWRLGSYESNVFLMGRHSLSGKKWKHSWHSQTLAGQLWKHFQEYYLPNPQTEQRSWKRKWRSQKSTLKITNHGFEKRTKCEQMHIWMNSSMLYFHPREIQRGGCYNAQIWAICGTERYANYGHILELHMSSMSHRMTYCRWLMSLQEPESIYIWPMSEWVSRIWTRTEITESTDRQRQEQ